MKDKDGSFLNAKYWIDLYKKHDQSPCFLKDEKIQENTLLIFSTKETIGQFCGAGYGGEWVWSNNPLRLMEYVKEIELRIAVIDHFDMVEKVDVKPYFENIGVTEALKSMLDDQENIGVLEWRDVINQYLWWIEALDKMNENKFDYEKVKEHFNELNNIFSQNNKCITKLTLFKNCKEALPELKSHNNVEITDDIQKMFSEDYVD